MPLELLAGAAAQGISTGINAIGQGIANAQQNKQNLNFYNMQRADNLSDWNRQNEYNSPASQMNRLIMAGINPHTIGGQSIVASGVAQPIKNTERPNAPAAYQMNKAVDLYQTQMGIEQLKQMRLEQEKTLAEIDQIKSNTVSTSFSNTMDSKYGDIEREYGVDRLLAIINNLGSDTNLKSVQGENEYHRRASILMDNEIKEIERMFTKPMLQGKTELQKGEIERLKLANQRSKYENLYVPQNARNSAQRLEYDTQLQKQQMEMLNTLPPQLRYVVEKLGGPVFLGTILRSLLGKK